MAGCHLDLDWIGVLFAEEVRLAHLQHQLDVGRLVGLQGNSLALAAEPDEVLQIAADDVERRRRGYPCCGW
jgi:hypothetical protein